MFLQQRGALFGLADVSQVRLVRAKPPDEVGMEHVRFRQVYGGIPVTGGEVIVHLRGSGVVAVNATLLGELENLDTQPVISAADAITAARGLIEKHFGVTDPTFSKPRLEIFNRGVLEGGHYPTHLTWFVEATGPRLREYIWVDSAKGVILLHFSQLPDARNRQIYNGNSLPGLPGTLCRSEGSPPHG